MAIGAFIGGEKSPNRPILYVKENCFFCKKVLNSFEDLASKIEIRDVKEEKYRQELIRTGGKPQIPCLIVDGKALYESTAIIAYFQNHPEILIEDESVSTP